MTNGEWLNQTTPNWRDQLYKEWLDDIPIQVHMCEKFVPRDEFEHALCDEGCPYYPPPEKWLWMKESKFWLRCPDCINQWLKSEHK